MVLVSDKKSRNSGNILKIKIRIRLHYRAGNQNEKFCKLIWLNTGIHFVPVLWVLETSVLVSGKIHFAAPNVPGFSLIKMRHFWQCVQAFWLPQVGENIFRCRRAINQPLTGRNKRRGTVKRRKNRNWTETATDEERICKENSESEFCVWVLLLVLLLYNFLYFYALLLAEHLILIILKNWSDFIVVSQVKNSLFSFSQATQILLCPGLWSFLKMGFLHIVH